VRVPDFRANTLGTCKHIEAVLASLAADAPPQFAARRPRHPAEIYLRYGEQLLLALHLPPRPSDPLRALADDFFDSRGLWKAGEDYPRLLDRVGEVPEQVVVQSDAMEHISREIDRHAMAERERELVEQLDRGELHLDLLNVPLYAYQMRGALFAAFRGRCILGDDMGLGKTVQTLAGRRAPGPRARHRARPRGRPGVGQVPVGDGGSQVHGPTGAGDRGHHRGATRAIQQSTFYRLVNYEIAVRDLDELNAWQPDLIVLDEAQRIKNWASKTSMAVKKLKAAEPLGRAHRTGHAEDFFSIVPRSWHDGEAGLRVSSLPSRSSKPSS